MYDDGSQLNKTVSSKEDLVGLCEGCRVWVTGMYQEDATRIDGEGTISRAID